MPTYRKSSTLVLAGIVMSACQDLPTTTLETITPKEMVAQRYSALGRVNQSAAKCYVSRRVYGREYAYQYGILRLHFPVNTLAPDGSTQLFRWRVQEPGQEPLVVGSCEIPSTPEAIEFAKKRLGLHSMGGRPDEMLTTQGCVTGGVCPIDGIVVTAPGPSTWGWGGGGGGGFGGGGGCDGYDASVCDTYDNTGVGNTADPGPDGTYRPECDRDGNGHCVTRELQGYEWDLLGQKISQLRTSTAACARAKGILEEFHAMGPQAQRIRVWEGHDVQWDPEDQRYEQRLGQVLSDVHGRYIEYDAYWVMRDQELIAHEALHMYLNEINSPLTGKEAHVWIAAEEKRCAGTA